MPRISQDTMNRIEELDLAEFATLLGDQLTREGRHYYTYRNDGENTPSLCITPSKRMWTAFGSTEGGRDAISYYAYRKFNNPYPTGEKFIEAVEGVAEIAGIEIEYEGGQKWTPAGFTGQPKVKNAPPAPPESPKKDNPILNQFNRRVMEEFPLQLEHVNHFKEKRKLNDRQIQARQYRSLTENKQARYSVTNKIMKELGEPEGIPGFMFLKGKQANYWTLGGRPGILLPFRDIFNHVHGFQLRYDNPQVEVVVKGKGSYHVQGSDEIKVVDKETGSIIWEGKEEQLPQVLPGPVVILSKRRWYGWLASSPAPERGILKGTSSDPAPYHCAVPTSVLERWRPGQSIKEVMDTSTVWWGEGPIKGDIAADFTEEPHLQAAGVSSWRILLEPTLELKPKRVILGFDADAQTKEDSVGKAVLNCIKGAKPILNEHGIELAIYVWPEEAGKGIDDLFNNGFKGHLFPI
ncbi:DUF3854 domain-containing protein [Cohnella sp. AR92]|uniref:DUF3854 domain-containing protein n=1 Tax=Cohnella sp. AR92 TaxID=648716 RepID=UPI00131566BC|nr:DUF3854 domain-containing protein [Cohnella sp. AR92]